MKMENVKAEEYIVKPIDTGERYDYGVFKANSSPMGADRLVINCNDNEDDAMDIADLLNLNTDIVCWSYCIEEFGSLVLSELYRLGYRLISHASCRTDYEDGSFETTVNDVILHRVTA